MPVKLTCPNGHAMMIRDEHVGKRVKCPKCGVGMLAEPLEAAPVDAIPVEPARAAVTSMPPPTEEVVDWTPELEERGRKRGKKQGRQRRRIEKTRALALVSTALAIQIGRMIALALAVALAFLDVFMPGFGTMMGLSWTALASLLGIVVAVMCIGASQKTGGTGYIIAALVVDMAGVPLGFGGHYFGTLHIPIALAGAACKVTAWILWILYLIRLADYLGEEADEHAAQDLLGSTFLLLGEYALFLMISAGLSFWDRNDFGRWLQWLILAPILIAIGWFVVHCIIYLIKYIDLLMELRKTIANSGVGVEDLFVPGTAVGDRDVALRERLQGGRSENRPLASVPILAIVLPIAAFFVLVLFGGGGYLLYRYWTPQGRAQALRAEFEERSRPLLPTDRDFHARVIRELKSGDLLRQRNALAGLAKAEPKERQGEIAKILEGLTEDKNFSVRNEAIVQYARWGDRDTAIAKFMNRLASSDDHSERPALIEALGILKAERAIEPIAARLTNTFERAAATKALQSIGPPAEGAVRKLLTQGERGVPQDACKILRAIGTRASVPDLQNAAESKDRALADAAKDALANIAARHDLDLSALKETKPPAKVEPPAPPPVAAKPPREPPPAARLAGLLAYWDFDDDEIAQKTKDLSANGLEGTIRGPGRVPGIRGKGLQFPGAEQWFDYGTSPRFNFEANTGFTIACWVKTSVGNGTIVSQRKEGDASPVLDITIESGNLAAMVRQDGDDFGQAARARGKLLNDDQWHHVVLTRQGDAIELLLDGVSVGKGQGAQAGGAITTDLRALGSERYWLKKPGLGDPTFKGAIDEFCIFGRTLTEGEIRALAQAKD